MADTVILEYLFCCQFTTNHKIMDLLEDLATKKHKCPTITNKLKFYGDNYRQLYTDVLKHFKIKDSDNGNDGKVIKNWSSIRKKALKDLILKNYIIEVKNKFKFDETTTNNLKRDLMIGLNFKNINDKNIVIESNRIANIVGLNLGTNTYSWDYDIFSYN